MSAITVSRKSEDFASEGGHWYDATTGEPRYTIIGRNGKERGTTLADARKGGLVPSVTTIAKVEAKPALTNWLVQQGMMACLTLPRVLDENDTDFMKRALEDSKQQTRAAAERGSYLHGLLEKSVPIECLHRDVEHEDEGYVLPVLQWLWKNFPGYTWHVERTIPTSGGYGGKVDLHGTHPTLPPVVFDYKFKDFDDPAKKLAYDEHCTQLCAYSMALFRSLDTRMINLFVSSTVPGLFVVREWNIEDKIYGWRAFCAMKDLWCARNRLGHELC